MNNKELEKIIRALKLNTIEEMIGLIGHNVDLLEEEEIDIFIEVINIYREVKRIGIDNCNKYFRTEIDDDDILIHSIRELEVMLDFSDENTLDTLMLHNNFVFELIRLITKSPTTSNLVRFNKIIDEYKEHQKEYKILKEYV